MCCNVLDWNKTAVISSRYLRDFVILQHDSQFRSEYFTLHMKPSSCILKLWKLEYSSQNSWVDMYYKDILGRINQSWLKRRPPVRYTPCYIALNNNILLYIILLENQNLRESHAMERHSSDKQTPEYRLCGGTAGNWTQDPRVSAWRPNHYAAMKHSGMA